MIRVAVIGYGYWGPNLARNFAQAGGTELAAIADLSEERLALAAKNHPGVDCSRDIESVLLDPKIDAVAIATPVGTHYELARKALVCGKHVWVRKAFHRDFGAGARTARASRKEEARDPC